MKNTVALACLCGFLVVPAAVGAECLRAEWTDPTQVWACHDAAEAGDVELQYRLGKAYADGHVVPYDIGEALEWLYRAIRQEHAEALVLVADLYVQGEFDGDDRRRVLRTLIAREPRTSLEEGRSEIQFAISRAHYSGWDVEQNVFEAAKWLQAAAEQGHLGAQTVLGGMYADGELGWETRAQAVRWLEAAAKQGGPGAQSALGKLYADGEIVQQDASIALHWLEAAAGQGYANAQYELARILAEGELVTADRAEALRLLWLVEEQIYKNVYEEAMTFLAGLLTDGQGQETDQEELARLLTKLAFPPVDHLPGNARAQYELGKIYASGTVPAPRFAGPDVWFGRAASQGHIEALDKLKERATGPRNLPSTQYELGQMYAMGWGVLQDEAEGLRWYELAAKNDHADAQFALGDAYLTGSGVEADRNMALYWFERARGNGHPYAGQKIDELRGD